MRRFTNLFFELDRARGVNARVEAMVRYFREAEPADAAWAVALLAGNRRFRRPVTGTLLRRLATEVTGLPPWLVAECYSVVGDLGESIALLLSDEGVRQTLSTGVPDGSPSTSMCSTNVSLRTLIEEHTLPLAGMGEDQQAKAIASMWNRLSADERLVWHKIMLGSFRVGVAEKNVVRALADVAGIDQAEMAWHLTGHWTPSAEHYLSVINPAAPAGDGSGDGSDTAGRAVASAPASARSQSGPYPFYLAHQLDEPPCDDTLGLISGWQAEWKYDGIRAQIIRRADGVMIWSRGDELINEAFPELVLAAEHLPSGTVLDGELLAWEHDRPLPFSLLQRRLNRKRVELMLWDEVPIAFRAFDLLESDGVDLREVSLDERRARLEHLLHAHDDLIRPIGLTNAIASSTWEELAALRSQSRDRGVEGLMLKKRTSTYGVGRKRGDWWKWKIDPYTVDAILIAAQRGHGRRAGLYTDFTFGVWDMNDRRAAGAMQMNDKESDEHEGIAAAIVPVTKAYSGLTDAEFREVSRFIRAHTIGEHGPYRSLEPRLVFEIGFEGIRASTRHRSGIALRFPRMLRWRTDKAPGEADTLQDLQHLLAKVERRVGADARPSRPSFS